MDENRLNDNDKTMVFNPVQTNNPESAPKEEQGPYRTQSVKYSNGQNNPYPPQKNYEDYEDYDDYDDDDDYEDEDYYEYEEKPRRKDDTNITLIVLTVVVSVVFIATLIWGIFTFANLKKDNVKEDVIVEEAPEEIPEEVPEEVVEEEEKNILYNMIFYSDSVEKEGNFYTVRVKLYNKSMVFEEERRVVINESTQIVEDGKQLSLVSFISVIENLAQENVVFKGKINEKTKEIVNISYEKEILEVPEEEEPEIEEEPSEEDPSSEGITTGIEEPEEGEKKVIIQ